MRDLRKQPPLHHISPFLVISAESNSLQNGRRKTQLNSQAFHTRLLGIVGNVNIPPDVIKTHANLQNSTSKNADDVVITLAIRTPLTKGFKGGFKDTELDYLLYALMKKVIEKSKLDPQLVEDICCGNVCRSPEFPTCQRYQGLTCHLAGLRWQSRIQTPSCCPCSRLPKHNRRLHRKSILLLRPQGYTGYCKPNCLR
jgi:hypothetical protein